MTHSTDAQIQWIAKRLRDCESSHATCTNATASQMPTRVLDLEYNSDNILLVDGQDCVGQYAALSHCWGPPSSPPYKTTLRSITAGRSIALKNLTEVVRQTVEVTRRLLFRYLWIDALCIIQDSPEDWQYEASKMASVYQNAHLTIAISRSANSHAPFLRNEGEKPGWIYTTGYANSYMEEFDPDTKFKHLARTCAIPYESNLTEKPGTIYLKEINEDRMVRSVTDNADAPLQSRAWTLQERILSPRMIFFDERELMWECCAGTMLQSRECILEDVSNRWAMYVPSNNDITRVRMSSQGMRKALLAQKIPETGLSYSGRATDSELTSSFSAGLHDLWLDVLTAYALRSLTYRDDTLIAIAGIADRMQRIVKDTYLFGIWKDDFRRDLLWSISEGASLESGQSAVLPARKPQSNGPSWSWASRIFQPHISQFVACIVRDLIYVEDCHSARFIDCEVGLLKTSRITGGKLLLRGFACSVVLNGAPLAQWSTPSIGCQFDSIAEVSANVNIDDTSQMVDISKNRAGRTWNVPFECFVVGLWAYDAPAQKVGEKNIEPKCYGLLLRLLEDGSYERVGQIIIKPGMG